MTIVINASSGKAEADLIQKIRAALPNARIKTIRSGHNFKEELHRTIEQEDSVVVIAGGDGTVSAAASELLNTKKVLGVLPLGTFNHFARDAGIPLDLNAALENLQHGHVRRVDVAEANGHVFLNNSSLGIYPRVVKMRRKRFAPIGKWVSFIRAVVKVLFRHFPIMDVRLHTDGKEIRCKTPFVFIGNNRYDLETLPRARRTGLDEGVLYVCFTHCTRRLKMLKLIFKALMSRLSGDADLEAFCTNEVLVETAKQQMSCSVDGEVVKVDAPIHYSVRPRALNVLVPV